jgi:hypothetical protein
MALRYAWWPSLRTAAAAGLLFGPGHTCDFTVLGLACLLAPTLGALLRGGRGRRRARRGLWRLRPAPLDSAAASVPAALGAAGSTPPTGLQ